MKTEEILKTLAEQFLEMMKWNNKLLEENLRLWKENSDLRRKLDGDVSE